MKAKRLLAMLMALVMMLSLMPISVLAADDPVAGSSCCAFYTETTNSDSMIGSQDAFYYKWDSRNVYLDPANSTDTITQLELVGELANYASYTTSIADNHAIITFDYDLPATDENGIVYEVNVFLNGSTVSHTHSLRVVNTNGNEGRPHLEFQPAIWDAAENKYVEDLSVAPTTALVLTSSEPVYGVIYAVRNENNSYRETGIVSDSDVITIEHDYTHGIFKITPKAVGTANLTVGTFAEYAPMTVTVTEAALAKPYLACSYVSFVNDEIGYRPEDTTYTEYIFEYPHHINVQFFLVYPDGTRTGVPWESIIAENSNLISIQGVTNPEDPYVCRIVPKDTGSTSVRYDDYSMDVTIQLPAVAFYTQPSAAVEYYVDNDGMLSENIGFNVTKNDRTVYLVLTGKRNFTNVELLGELADYATCEINDLGTVAAITFNEDLPTTSNWGESYYISMDYDSTEPGESGGGSTRAINVVNKVISMLYFNFAQWDNNGYVDENVSGGSSLFTSPGVSHDLYFHFTDGENDINVTADRLKVSNPDIVTLTTAPDSPLVTCVEIEDFGNSFITYTHTDGKEYSALLHSELPQYGFYSQPELKEENYLTELNLSETNNTVYFIANYGWKMSNVSANSEFSAAQISLSDNGEIATITFPEANYSGNWLQLSFTRVNWDGESEGDEYHGIRFNFCNTGLYFRAPSWDENGNAYEDLSRSTENTFNSSPKKGTWAIFYFFDGKTEHRVADSQLFSDNKKVVTLNLYNEFPILEPVGFGSANICYTHTDGKTYSLPVTSELYYADFYSSATPSEESYLPEFTVTDTNRTFYLAALDGYRISNVHPGDNWPESDFVVADDGSYVTITIKDGAEWKENWGSSELIYTLVGENSFTWEGQMEYISLINGGDKMFFYYAGIDESGNLSPEIEYPQNDFWTAPGNITIFPMLMRDGVEVNIDPTQLTSSNTNVVTITPNAKRGVAYLEFVGFGTAEIIYSDGNNTYKLPVSVNLPDVGFYTSPEASKETYVYNFPYSKDNNTLYLINISDMDMQVKGLASAPDGSTITDTGNPNVYKVTLAYDKTIPEGTFGLAAAVSMTNFEGSTFDFEASCTLIIQAENPCKDGHTIVDSAAVAPTCVDGGLTAGKHCSVCGEITEPQIAIAATGHSYGEGTVIAEPTCTTDGKAVAKCANCSATLNGRNLNELLVKELTDTAYMIAGAPVYDYNAEYIVSRINPKFFRDWDYSIRLEIPADEYESVVNKYFKLTDELLQDIRAYATGEGAQYEYIQYNADANTYTLRLTGGFGGWEDPRKYVGYVQNGNTYTAYYCYVNYVYLSEVLSNGMTEYEYAETLGNPDTIEYNGHIFTNSPDGYCYIESYENSGRAVTMERNGNVMRIVDVFEFTDAQLPTSFDDIDGGATGHKDNNSDYHCDVCGVNVCASHVPSSIPAVPASCTATGLTEGTKCANCGLILEQQEVTNKTDHTEAVVPAVAPTCTKEGLTEGKICSVCNAVIVAQKSVPIAAHSYNDGTITTAPSCTKEGVKTFSCSACGHTYTEAVAKTAHALTAVPAVDATYTAAGTKAYYICSACDKLFSDALGTNAVTMADLVIPQKVEVTAGKAEVKEEVIEEAISNSTETTVTLPLTETKEETTAAQLPVASLEKIVEAEKDLTVETNYATVTMDTAALQTITEAAGEASDIELKVVPMQTTELNTKQQAAVAEKNVAAVISAEILCNGENLHDFEGGKVTVKVPFTMESGASASDYVLIYVDDMGNMEIIDAVLEGGYLIAVLDHFSEYVVINTKTEPAPTPTPPVDPTPDPEPIDNPFVDVAEKDYFYAPVLWAVQKGITGGIDATHFAPNNACTRGQVVTFLWRANGSPEPKSTSHPFTDISADKYYYKAVLWAVENGITAGLTATTFAPNNACTRGQIATFLWRANGSPEPQSSNNPFSDVNAGPFYKAILWAVEEGITTGYTDGTFRPSNVCTRGNIVTFLYRAEN